MADQTDQPKEWSVQNHAFVGYVLVDMPAEKNAMGVMQKPKEGWLPFAVDLRPVNEIRQAEHDRPERCSLYHNGTFIGAVNCSYADLLPRWVRARNLFDEPNAQPYHAPMCDGIRRS